MGAMRAIQIPRLDGPQAAELVELDEPTDDERGHRRRTRGRGGVSRCAAIPRALSVQGGVAVSCRAPRSPAWSAARPSGSGFAEGDRVAGLTMLNGAMAEVVALQPDRVFKLPDIGVVRGRRGPAVQRPHHASRAAHPRPAGRRRDRAGARRGGRHRNLDAATGAGVGGCADHRGGRRRGARSQSPRPRAPPMWCWPTVSRTRSRS